MAKSTARPTQRRPSNQHNPERWWQNWVLWSVLGAVVVVIVIVGILMQQAQPGLVGAIDGLQSFRALARDHTAEPVTYAQTPPVGGEHNAVWQNCGIYDTPVANENAVHSLEHGAVWITYQPDLPAAKVELLRTLVRGRGHALLSPYVGLPTPVVASAWGYQVQVDDAADPRLARFLTVYEQGPQTPEPGAVCVGGVGTPIDG
jgi:hypothetical protein